MLLFPGHWGSRLSHTKHLEVRAYAVNNVTTTKDSKCSPLVPVAVE